MLYLLHGKDTFRRDARVNEIRSAYREKHPDAFGEHVVDAEEQDASERLGEALAQGGGLFDTKSLVIASGFLKKDKKALKALLDERDIAQNQDAVLLLVEGKLKKSELKDVPNAETELFDPLSEADRVQWIGRYISEHGPKQGPRKIQKGAATMLAGLGDDLGRIAQELERLMAYAAGEEVISEEHVTALLSLRQEETIFPISDGICDREPTKALTALARLSGSGDDARGLLSYALKETRQLIRAHAALSTEVPGDPQELFGAKPFVWKKRTAQARKWSEEEIRELAALARDADMASKRGSSAKEALEALILGAASPPKQRS